jgi:hypothetical protein
MPNSSPSPSGQSSLTPMGFNLYVSYVNSNALTQASHLASLSESVGEALRNELEKVQ